MPWCPCSRVGFCPKYTAAAAAKSLQSCPTLCDPIDGLLPGSSVPGILQARTLEWVAMSFSSAWTWKVKVKSLSCVWLSVTPWTVAHQAPPSMGFSRQEYWSGVPKFTREPYKETWAGLGSHPSFWTNNPSWACRKTLEQGKFQKAVKHKWSCSYNSCKGWETFAYTFQART